MREVTSRGKTYRVPERLDEMLCDQYAYYCMLGMALSAGMESELDVRRKLLGMFTGCTGVRYRLLAPEHIAELDAQMHVLDGFFVEKSGRRALRFDTPLNLLPEYRGYASRVGDWLDGLTFGKFVECLTVMEGCSAGSSEDELSEAYEHVARVLYHIPEGEQCPEVLLFHAPCLLLNVWKAITSGPVEVNGQKLNLSIIFKGTGERKPDDRTGWTGITFEVANAGLFGTVREVEETDFWLVLIYLYRCKFEYLHDNSK